MKQMIERKYPSIQSMVTAAGFFCAASYMYLIYGPWSLGNYMSDAAIPIIMGNDHELRKVHLYLFGQDRFGGWPFILMFLFQKITGLMWSPESYYLIQCLWLCLGAVFAGQLSSKVSLVLFFGFYVMIFVHPKISSYLLSPDSVYLWQAPGIFLGWLAIRQWAGTCTNISEHSNKHRFALAKCTVLCLLPIWTSVLSTVILLTITFFEWLIWHLGSETRAKFRLKGFTQFFCPVFLAQILELLIKHLYRTTQFASKATEYDLDLASIASRFVSLIGQFHEGSFLESATAIINLLGFAAIMGLICRRKTAHVRSFAQLAPIIASCFTGGLAYSLVIAASKWWELSGFDSRYLSLAHFLFGFGALTTCALMIASIQSERWTKHVTRAWVACLVIVLLSFHKGPEVNEDYFLKKRLGKALEQNTITRYLLGSYWGTYSIVGHQQLHPMNVIIEEGDYERTPWFRSLLKKGAIDSIIVSHYLSDTFGPRDKPREYITQHGVNFRFTGKLAGLDLEYFSCYQRVPSHM